MLHRVEQISEEFQGWVASDCERVLFLYPSHRGLWKDPVKRLCSLIRLLIYDVVMLPRRM